MYNSTRKYVRFRIEQLMEQCDITLTDIQTIVDEMNVQEYEHPEKLITKLESNSKTAWNKLLFGSDINDK